MKRKSWKIFWVTMLVSVLIAGFPVGRQIHHWEVERRLDHFEPLILYYAQANNLSPELVRAVVRVESGGDPWARSRKDARGLMQVTPITERELARRANIAPGDIFDPEYNIMLGTTYLRLLLNRFGGDYYLALAAYNAGPTRVQDYVDANAGLSGKEIVTRCAPRVTVEYCRAILEESGWKPPSPSDRMQGNPGDEADPDQSRER